MRELTIILYIFMSNNVQKVIIGLEVENSNLKTQILEARAIIKALKQENQGLVKRLSMYKGDSILTYDSTFITSQFMETVCENCDQEVPFTEIDLHMVQCSRNFCRCKVCNCVIRVDEIGLHTEQQKGEILDLVNDIERGDIASLDMRMAHGAQINSVTNDVKCNSLIHIAVNSGKLEVIEYLLKHGLSINTPNAFGELPLHLACNKQKNISTVKYLVSKGALSHIKNSLGDSCIDLAQRLGFHEAVLFFQQSLSRPSSSISRSSSKYI